MALDRFVMPVKNAYIVPSIFFGITLAYNAIKGNKLSAPVIGPKINNSA